MFDVGCVQYPTSDMHFKLDKSSILGTNSVTQHHVISSNLFKKRCENWIETKDILKKTRTYGNFNHIDQVKFDFWYLLGLHRLWYSCHVH